MPDNPEIDRYWAGITAQGRADSARRRAGDRAQVWARGIRTNAVWGAGLVKEFVALCASTKVALAPLHDVCRAGTVA